MTDKADQVELYGQHLVEKSRRFQDILVATQFDEIVIAAGDSKMQFADDMAYPFVANPYFREWVPLGKRAGSYVQIAAKLGSTAPVSALCRRYLAHRPSESACPGFEAGS